MAWAAPVGAATQPPATAVTDGSWEKVKAAGRIVVGTSAPYPPFEFFTDDNGIIGSVEDVNGVFDLAGIQQPIHPGQELLGAVVRVQDDPCVVRRGELPHVVRPGDCPCYAGSLAFIAHTFAGKKDRAPVRKLDDHPGL